MKLMREVAGYPHLRIDAEGVVWIGAKRIPTTNVQDRHGISMIAILWNNEFVTIWELMSIAYYDGGLILPRDGNFFNCRKSDLFNCRKSGIVHVEYMSSDAITDTDDIRRIWWMYCLGLRCAEILEEMKWTDKYTVEDIKNVVRDVLVQGIR